MKILAKLYKYNANTSNKNTSDCVARSISIALGIDYDEVKRGLIKLGHKLNLPSWNYFQGFTQYIRDAVGYNIIWRKPTEVFDRSLTVEEFSDELYEGTYLLLCGKSETDTSHMIALIDGTYYDSWDSSKRIVSRFMVIDDEAKNMLSTQSVDSIAAEVMSSIHKYVNRLDSRCSYFKLTCGDTTDSTDSFSKQFSIHCDVLKSNFPDEVKPYADTYVDDMQKTFYIKINPAMSDESNCQTNVQRLKYQIREWDYVNRRSIEDIVKEVQTSVRKNPSFKGDISLLSKIPKSYQPYILHATDNHSSEYTDRYNVVLKALPDDPELNYRDPYVTCYGDTLKELINGLKSYFEDYSRFGYDY